MRCLVGRAAFPWPQEHKKGRSLLPLHALSLFLIVTYVLGMRALCVCRRQHCPVLQPRKGSLLQQQCRSHFPDPPSRSPAKSSFSYESDVISVARWKSSYVVRPYFFARKREHSGHRLQTTTSGHLRCSSHVLLMLATVSFWSLEQMSDRQWGKTFRISATARIRQRGWQESLEQGMGCKSSRTAGMKPYAVWDKGNEGLDHPSWASLNSDHPELQRSTAALDKPWRI